MMKLYKVVRVLKNGDLVSCAIDHRSKKYFTRYKVGELLEVKDTLGFFCFENLSDAERSKTGYQAWYKTRKYKILLVKAISKINKPEIISSTDKLSIFYRSNLYKLIKNCIDIGRKPPNGTICCKKIKVLG